MGMLYEYWDDVAAVTEPSAEEHARVTDWLAQVLPPITQRGEYRNRRGERVTWQSSGDGRYVMLQTWPDERGGEQL